MKTENITTHDIRTGDRIASHGMILLVDREPHTIPSNGLDISDEYAPAMATRAVIENWTEILAEAEGDNARGVINSTAEFIVAMVKGDVLHAVKNGRTPDAEPRWTIQGNGLARWSRITE